jgi:hypothetical protein
MLLVLRFSDPVCFLTPSDLNEKGRALEVVVHVKMYLSCHLVARHLSGALSLDE